LCLFLIPVIINSSSTLSVHHSCGILVFIVTFTLAGTICFGVLSLLPFKYVHSISISALVAKLQCLSLLMYPVSPYFFIISSFVHLTRDH
jgi:hypothetical protein